jgi:phenylpropionate dioxygenase-like ring-hydroxylating dioxygenase large terminal subunit
MADGDAVANAGKLESKFNPAYQKLLDTDSHPIPAAFRRDQPMAPGPTLVPVERYTSRAYFELEKEKLWKRVWQVACHEDDLPNVGDYLPYDITDMSFLVVRTGEDEFKAYYNACLHRGRKLRERRGTGATELRCQYHGWTWSLEGKLLQVPCIWDFAGLKKEEQALPEVRVERWGRFIFINPDPNCEPLEAFLGDLSSNFEVLPYERRYKQAHVAKILECNWKAAQEAFMEAYHVLATHPQILMGGMDDADTKFDVFGNYSRAIRCGALESTGMPEWEILPEDGTPRVRHPLNGWVYERTDDGLVRVTTPKGATGLFTPWAEHVEGELGEVSLHLCRWVGGPELPAGSDAVMSRAAINSRQSYTEMQREALRPIIPSIVDKIADIEFSSVYLTLFPNFHPWGSFNRIVYRFRPNGDNHEQSIMEVMYLGPIPENGEKPASPPIHWLAADEPWTNAPELGMLARVLTQDDANLKYVQQGLHATSRKCIQFADYAETKIRHFHELLGKWVG